MNTQECAEAPWIKISCPECGGVVYAASTRPGVIDRREKRTITRLVTTGHNVDHGSPKILAGSKWGCQCGQETTDTGDGTPFFPGLEAKEGA